MSLSHEDYMNKFELDKTYFKIKFGTIGETIFIPKIYNDLCGEETLKFYKFHKLHKLPLETNPHFIGDGLIVCFQFAVDPIQIHFQTC